MSHDFPMTREELELQLAIVAGMMPKGSKLVKLGGAYCINAYEEMNAHDPASASDLLRGKRPRNPPTRKLNIAIVTAAPTESPAITEGMQVHVPGAIWLPVSLRARPELIQRACLLMGEFVVHMKRSSIRSLPGRKDFNAMAREKFTTEELQELLGMGSA